KSTVGYCPSGPCPFLNAFWDGIQIYYGQGFASVDDVVGHEMTHGVTQYESGLFYYMQSGAINESLSDVWGEFIDLTNGKGNDADGVRWLVGENLPIGAIRNMKDPTASPFYDPDKISSSYYYCTTGDWDAGDYGGVHSNSGVNNKAAYLMTDGGSFNGKTVTGIGITKVAKIYYEVQTNLLTSASDYQDLYDGLLQACANLTGTAGITAADCQQVKNAVDATQMNQQPASCAANEAPVCPVGQTATNLFFDNLEDTESGNWTHGPVSELIDIDEWYYPQNFNPYGFDATYATSGLYNLWGYDVETSADFAIAMVPNVVLPVGNPAYMRFNHAYGFESPDWDGGVLEYSTDGGSSWTDAGPLFIDNGYNGAIHSNDANPLTGRSGFVANSNGYISSRLDLASLAGGNVKFRFRIGTDGLVGDWGWFIDDIRIYTCDWAEPPELIYLPFIRKP
ncbi:MAG TPA: M4 family metallopeptidase, partial [Anaerolineales bacterium]